MSKFLTLFLALLCFHHLYSESLDQPAPKGIIPRPIQGPPGPPGPQGPQGPQGPPGMSAAASQMYASGYAYAYFSGSTPHTVMGETAFPINVLDGVSTADFTLVTQNPYSTGGIKVGTSGTYFILYHLNVTRGNPFTGIRLNGTTNLNSTFYGQDGTARQHIGYAIVHLSAGDVIQVVNLRSTTLTIQSLTSGNLGIADALPITLMLLRLGAQ